MQNCFLCEMNFVGVPARASGAKTDLRLYPIIVIGASTSLWNETSLLVFRF